MFPHSFVTGLVALFGAMWRKFEPLPHLPFVGRIQKLNVNASFPLGNTPAATGVLFARKNIPPLDRLLPSPKCMALPDTPSSTR